MTDAELIARLRGVTIKQHSYGAYTLVPDPLSSSAADRIEALVNERDQWIEHTKNAVWTDSEELKLANSRAERLEAALRKIGKTYPADNMRLIHGELQILNIVNTALKGDDHA